MNKLGRLLTAMVTPFDENRKVDYEQAKKLAVALIDSGSEGLVVVGTTGESPTLVREEELRLFREVKSAIGDRGTVVAGTGSNSTAEAVEATQEAEKIGVDAPGILSGFLIAIPGPHPTFKINAVGTIIYRQITITIEQSSNL